MAILKLNFFEFNKPSQRVANLLKSTAYGKPTTVHLLRQESQSIVKKYPFWQRCTKSWGWIRAQSGGTCAAAPPWQRQTDGPWCSPFNKCCKLPTLFSSSFASCLVLENPLSSHLPRCHAPCTWVDRVSRVITGCGARVLITLSAIHGNSIPTKDERSRLLFFDNPFNYH